MPYVGVIRASATLSLAGLYGNRETLEYELTAFCVGLPSSCGSTDPRIFP